MSNSKEYYQKNKKIISKYNKKWYQKNRIEILKKAKKYRRKNRIKYSQYLKNRNIKLRQQVFDHYGWICNCCGETHKSFLSIDHVNNDGNSDPTGVTLYIKIIKENYPDKYQILCMNCNFSKRINNGICEHGNIYKFQRRKCKYQRIR